MEEQTIARLVLNAFREGDKKILLKISSEHVCLLSKVLGSESHEELENFIWPMNNEFQMDSSNSSFITAIQTSYDPDSSLDLFSRPIPLYSSPDPETKLCLLETNIVVIKETNDLSSGVAGILLFKEDQYWKFHNAFVIKQGLPLDYYQKIGWFETIVESSHNSVQPRADDCDQLSLDDYWGNETSDDEPSEEKNQASAKSDPLLNTKMMRIPDTGGPASRIDAAATSPPASFPYNSEASSHIYNILKGTYGLARSQGISKEMFESLVNKILQHE